MASRTVLARLVIDGVDGVVTGFKRAGEAAVNYGSVAMKSGQKAGAWISKHRSDLDSIGGNLLKVGAVGVAALGGLTKVAIDWESAWAGVTKTVDGTPEQMQAIEQGLRDMTKVLPASHEELAAVAEAAGQLGVKTEDVLGFTRTMVDLGETTNLSSDEAATSLQQMMNVMGTAGSHVDRLGSTIVALGNNGASTERDIVRMGQRIAAAGGQVGMTETDVLGFAGALSSVGVEAEAGGTAISLTFKQIDADVREGGKQLKLIAETAGMTADEFTAAWKDDPALAIAAFVEGMGEMQSSGEDVNALLGELDISGIRQTDSLLRLAAATEAAGGEQNLLREQLELAGVAWEENSALVEEAAQRYETPAARAQMAINSLKDEAINLGGMMLPIFDEIVKGISNVAEAVSGVPDGVKLLGLMIAGVGSAGALAAGGILKLVTTLSAARQAMQVLGITARGATLAMGAIGLALTAAGYVLASWSNQQSDAKDRVEGFTAAIKEQGEALGEATTKEAARQLQEAGALDIAEQLGLVLEDVTEAALGNADAYERVTTAVDAEVAALDKEIQAKLEAGEYTGDLTEEQRRLMELQQDLTKAVDTTSDSYKESVENTKQLDKATGSNADTAKDAAVAAQELAEAEAEKAAAVDEARKAMEEAIETAHAYGNALLGLSGSQMGMNSSVLDLKDHMAELREEGDASAFTLDTTTRAGIENQKALDSVAKSTMSYIETLYEQGASTQQIAKETHLAREAWIEAATDMGMAKDEAVELAAAYFKIPAKVQTEVETPGVERSQEQVETLRQRIENLPDETRPEIKAILDSGDIDEAERRLDALSRDRWITIRATVRGGGLGIEIPNARGNIIDYYAHGGLRPGPDVANRHLAGITPGGVLRVFGEPETKGEAYIPFREDTRPRSIRIWQETGRRLGVQGFATGGISGGSTSTTYGDNIIHAHFPNARNESQIERALMSVHQRMQQRGGR